MTIVLDSTFATAEDTAKALGVSKSRLKRLVRLAGPVAIEAERPAFRAGMRRAATSRRRGPGVTAKRKKQARGKTKKAAH